MIAACELPRSPLPSSSSLSKLPLMARPGWQSNLGALKCRGCVSGGVHVTLAGLSALLPEAS